MNTNLLIVLAQLPQFIKMAESLAVPGDTGEDKAKAVLSAIMPIVPADKLAQIQGWITLLVTLYNAAGMFKQTPKLPA